MHIDFLITALFLFKPKPLFYNFFPFVAYSFHRYDASFVWLKGNMEHATLLANQPLSCLTCHESSKAQSW